MFTLTRLFVAVFLLALSFAIPVEAAVDCRGTIPLPDDLRLTPPAADVPEGVARFAGAWSGAWRDARGNEADRTSTGCFFQVPYMSGLGGNLVALLPNGISVFRFADGDNYDLDAMILAGESIRPFCPPPATASTVPARVPLTSTELAAEVPGHTFAIGAQRLFFAPGQRLYGALPDDVDLGAWSITAEGRLCRVWTKWDKGLSRCYEIFREGEAYVFDGPGRFVRFVARRTPGGLEP